MATGTITTATMATAEGTTKRDHIVLFPFMAKGHLIPLLRLAARLSSRGLQLTIVTTPLNAPFVRRHLPPDRHPLAAVLLLPFPDLPPLPPGVESTDRLPSMELFPTFLRATSLLRDPFHRLLLDLVAGGAAASLPLCLISDFFLGWTLDVCREVGLPRLVFHGMSAFSLALTRTFVRHRPQSCGAAAFHVPGTRASLLFTQDEVSNRIKKLSDSADPANEFILQADKADSSSWGRVMNSFAEMDSDYVELLQSLYRCEAARTWLVGPLCLLPGADLDSELTEAADSDDGCLEWLDGKARDSVVYVSFGTQEHVSDAQLDEVAHGLALSGHEFLLVVRSPTWVSPVQPESLGSKVFRGWAPQMAVLRHAAVGGFLNHCGWNSVLESLVAGVPILAWPMSGDQGLNAKMVEELLGIGIRVARTGQTVRREKVSACVREIMGAGGRARERAAELGRAASEAVAEGGSSHAALEELLEVLRKVGGGGGDVV